MDDWYIVFGVIAACGIFFGIFWKIVMDVKKSSHARIDRVERDFSVMEATCNTRLASYVNKDDMKELRQDMHQQFHGLTKRIDSLLLALKNGHK
jgi:hypothetical protein